MELKFDFFLFVLDLRPPIMDNDNTDAKAPNVLSEKEANIRAKQVSDVHYEFNLFLKKGSETYKADLNVSFVFNKVVDTDELFFDFVGKTIETLGKEILLKKLRNNNYTYYLIFITIYNDSRLMIWRHYYFQFQILVLYPKCFSNEMQNSCKRR